MILWGLPLNPQNVTTIVSTVLALALLEGLLSADNALVLATMVRHLPKKQQKRALRYGIWGAFLFRGIAVVFAAYLLRFWWIEVVGGLYLLYLAIKHFVFGDGDAPGEVATTERGFWATVVNVELADIAFSVDSILAAVAVTDALPANLQGYPNLKLGILYFGGVTGIILMRYVAGVILILLERFKGLAAAAYYLVAWIGIKLLVSGLHRLLHGNLLPAAWVAKVPASIMGLPELPPWLFWGGMGLIVVGGLLAGGPKERST